jgi:glycerol-3-phosphate dehydrogenase
MKKNKHKIVVIGGGIHGLTSAIFLAQKGGKVVLLEKRGDLMQGTSGATHNRAHMGYHYPRSIETAKECLRGLNFFKKYYPQALFYPKEAYYLIDKKDSKTSFSNFKKFCHEINIPYKIVRSNDKFWIKDKIQCGFKVPEPVFDVVILTALLRKEAEDLGVKIVTNSEVIGLKKLTKGYKVISQEQTKKKQYQTDIILNATYAYTNNILKVLGLEEDMTKYELQKTEIVLAKSNKDLPALTVMDGNFISIMPLANSQKQNLFLIYDVSHSVIDREDGHFLDDTPKYPTNFKKMIANGKKYFPFIKDLKYVKSLYGFRPIPKETANDSRKTRIVAHKKLPGVYSIFEGKFISASLIAKKLIRMMEKDGVL